MACLPTYAPSGANRRYWPRLYYGDWICRVMTRIALSKTTTDKANLHQQVPNQDARHKKTGVAAKHITKAPKKK